MKCPTCGKKLGTESLIMPDERSMKKHGECFECSLWRERLSLVGNPNVAIIDGTFYTIGDEDDPSPIRGFGGDKFVIHSRYGKEIITTNLWCVGKIPKAWKDKFPDNADFFDCGLEERLKPKLSIPGIW